MRMQLLIASLIGLFFLIGCSTTSKYPKLQLKEYKYEKLENGLKVFFIEDHSLPYFSLSLLVDAGSSKDPKDLQGLANMVASLLDKGTKSKNATELAESLDFIGARYSIGATKDYTLLSASSLSSQKGQLIQLFSEMALEPSFKAQEMSRLQKRYAASIKQSIDSPSSFVGQALYDEVFGQHPYGFSTVGRLKTISKIRQKHINRFYLKNYRPNQSTLAVVGKFDQETRSTIKKAFSKWQPRERSRQALPTFPKISGKSLTIIHKKGATQAQVRIGAEGIRRKNADYLKVRLANTILGGAFASRLNDQIRDNLGLTYGISSYFQSLKQQGPFVITSFTRTEKTKKLVDEALKILSDFHEKGVSEEEVEQAKGLMLGEFPRAIETAEKLAFNLQILDFYGVEKEYLKNFLQDVEGISQKEVNQTVRKYFAPENLKIVILGDAKKIRSQFKEMEKVEEKKFQDFL